MIMYDLPRFKEFRKQGVKDATKLFHPKHFPEERQELTKMKKVYKFFEKIGSPSSLCRCLQGLVGEGKLRRPKLDSLKQCINCKRRILWTSTGMISQLFSGMFLQQAKWHQLKVCYVPDWKTKCFGDIVDFLYERVLPGLMKDCEDLDDSELKFDQKQSFLLSDIFRDINEDHCSDHYEKSGQKEDDKST